MKSRRTAAAAPAAPTMSSPTTFVVTQVRHALQHAVAIGACSAARFTIGSARVCARCNMTGV
jgi:hypothetical protein